MVEQILNNGLYLFDDIEQFRKKNTKIFQYLENKTKQDILLFDLSDILLQYPHSDSPSSFAACSTQYSNTTHFNYFLLSLFKGFNSEKGYDVDTAIVAFPQKIENMYEQYIDTISKSTQSGNEPTFIKNEILKWADMTKKLIWDNFCQVCVSYNKTRTLCSNSPLLFRMLWAIDRKKEELFFSTGIDKGEAQPTDIILYNFWGNDYCTKRDELKSHADILSVEEKNMFDPQFNIEYFNSQYRILTSTHTTEEESIPFLKKSISAMDLLHNLFIDFIKRLRQTRIRDKEFVSHIVEYWKMVTIDEIERIKLIDMVDTVFKSQKAVQIDDFRNYAIDSKTYNEVHPKMRIAKKCKLATIGFVKEYLEMINTEGYGHNWSAQLKALKIEYADIFQGMKEQKIIQPTFDYNVFLDAIESADFSSVFKSAQEMAKIYGKHKGYPGCVKFLVREIGRMLNNAEWYTRAAETVEPKYKGKNAIIEVERLNETDAAKDFANKVLKGKIPEYKFVARSGVR